MKNVNPKYSVGQTVTINKTQTQVEIVDIEIFDQLILYYTNDKRAYPENELSEKIYSEEVLFFAKIFSGEEIILKDKRGNKMDREWLKKWFESHGLEWNDSL